LLIELFKKSFLQFATNLSHSALLLWQGFCRFASQNMYATPIQYASGCCKFFENFSTLQYLNSFAKPAVKELGLLTTMTDTFLLTIR
jgi:hypothetical protein